MKKSLLSLAIAAAVVAPTVSLAQDAAPEAPAVNNGALSFSGAVDFTHAYYFRGYLQENDGLIVQPSVSVSAQLADNVSMYAGMWNSFHTKQTAGDDMWYEADFFTGVDIDLAPITLGLNYTLYTYPNGAFDAIHEVQAKVTFDDSTLSEDPKLVFSPYILVAYELADGNGSEDTYMEIGAAPSFDLGDTGLALSVPMAVGTSLDDYYQDFLGYATIGVATSVPLPMPAKYGEWNLNASLKYLYLFDDALQAANEGDSNEFVATVGVSFSY